MTDAELAIAAQTLLAKFREDEQALLLEIGIMEARLEVVREVIALLVGKPARGRPPRKTGKPAAAVDLNEVAADLAVEPAP